MKVLFYIHSLCVGGAETMVVDDLLSLKRAGNKVVLVIDYETNSFLMDRIKKERVDVIVLFPNATTPESLIKKLKNKFVYRFEDCNKKWSLIIKKFEPDIIHIHTFLDHFEAGCFPLYRIVYSFHSDVERSLRIGSKVNNAKLLDYASGGMSFFCLSARMKNEILNICPNANVYIAPNSVDYESLNKGLKSRKCFKELEIEEDAFLIGIVGRFHPVKNHEKALSIFSKVREIRPNSYLVLVGDGTKERVCELRVFCDSLGISENVKFLGLRSDARSLMGLFDAVLITSDSESFSLVAIEAQMAGITVVASDAIPSEVFCNDNCFVVAKDAPPEDWIPPLLQSKGTAPKNNEISYFDSKNINKIKIEHYAQILDKYRKQADE